MPASKRERLLILAKLLLFLIAVLTLLFFVLQVNQGAVLGIIDAGTPFNSTPFNVNAGQLESENFNRGVNGRAYIDDTPGNGLDSTYRSDENTDVDIKLHPTQSGNHVVGLFLPGESLRYTINVPVKGRYGIRLHTYSADAGRQINFLINGSSVTTIPVPQVANWNTPGVAALQEINLSSGEQVLSIEPLGGYVDFDAIEFELLEQSYSFRYWGDYDNDSAVDVSDLSLFAQNYLASNINCTLDLIGNNCRLDAADLAEFARLYKSDSLVINPDWEVPVASSSSSSPSSSSTASSSSSGGTIAQAACGVVVACPECVSEPTPTESINVVKEMEFPADDIIQGDYAAPVVTDTDGTIYAIYIEKVGSNYHTKIAKKTPNGTITTNTILDRTEKNLYHSIGSVALDKYGYIHYIGNIHYAPFLLQDQTGYEYKDYPWQYWISKRPRDITEFEFVGDEGPRGTVEKSCWANFPIPETTGSRTPVSCFVSYPFFAKDRNGELYLSHRERVRFDAGDNPQNMGADVNKYVASPNGKGTWVELGGRDYAYEMSTLFWSAKTPDSRMYQPMKPRVIFDKHNRMHVSTGVQAFGKDGDGGNNNSITHVLYACSDDGGQTWKNSKGQTYNQLPMTDKTGEVALTDPLTPKRAHNYTGLGIYPTGQPFATLAIDSTDWEVIWRTYNGNNWTNAGSYPGRYPGHIVIDDRGIITVFEGAALHRSYDKGATWRRYTIPATASATLLIDVRYTQETGNVRYLGYKDGKASVYTAKFY